MLLDSLYRLIVEKLFSIISVCTFLVVQTYSKTCFGSANIRKVTRTNPKLYMIDNIFWITIQRTFNYVKPFTFIVFWKSWSLLYQITYFASSFPFQITYFPLYFWNPPSLTIFLKHELTRYLFKDLLFLKLTKNLLKKLYSSFGVN